MLRPNTDPPTFKRGSLVPVASYLLIITVLSGLITISSGHSPPPVLGIGWGIFLVCLTVGLFLSEGAALSSLLPNLRTTIAAVGCVLGYWVLYNLVAFSLALGGVTGFETTQSRAASHLLPYTAAFASSLLFTAIPEEMFFRSYLQQKFIDLSGGGTRRAIAIGVGAVTILFALFHLPNWFLGSGHGIGPALVSRLLGLAVIGLAYGLVYALTGNLWLVALFHATMNQPPFMIAVEIPAGLHLVAGVVESATMVLLVYLVVRVVDSESVSPIWSQQAEPAVSDRKETGGDYR